MEKREKATAAMIHVTEIEALIGKPLCKSAFKFQSYWYPGPNRPMSNVIYNAGFDIETVDVKNHILYLVRAK